MNTNLYLYNDETYKDRYTPESNWVKLLFNQGRPLQTAELIEMQSVMQSFLKKGLDTLFANGTILNGLKFTPTSTTSAEIEFLMSAGRFYVDGIVLEIEAISINVPIQGEYNIGLLIIPKIITEEEDFNLRDPIKGGAAYGLPGASRLVWDSTLVLNDPSAFTIAKVVNGGLIQKEQNIYSKIDDSLAKYTYARTGNFCLPGGLETTVIDSQERSVADISKYDALNEAFTSANNITQSAYTEVINAKNSLDNIQSQLKQANNAYSINPTNSNLIVLQDLELRLADITNRFNELSRVYTSKKIISDKAEANLNSSKGLLVDKVYLSISPGVAYVEGYRVDIVSPIVVEIPKNLETDKVEGAIFTYSGSQAITVRNFFLNEGTSWDDIVNQNTIVTIDFTKLLYNQQFVSIQLSIPLNTTFFNSLNSFLSYLINELNKSTSQSLNGIDITSSDLIATKEVLRTVLKNNLDIEKVGNSLTFTSTTLNEVSNQVSVNINIKETYIESEEVEIEGGGEFIVEETVIVNDSNLLLVDVNSSNLAGAGRFNSFQLGFRPVADIISVTAELQENQRPIVRGPIPGTSDKLGDDSVFRIIKIYQGDTVFVEGRDYRLINQSEVDWSLSDVTSIEPNQGTTYYASFLYTQPLAKDIDYTLNNTTDSIEFIRKTPAPNQKFYVSYTYYLAKAGVLSLDRKGIANYIMSSSSINPVTPILSNEQLTIATFKLYADRTEVFPSDCKVITLTELQEVVNQVKRTTCELESHKLDISAQLKASNSGIIPTGYFNNTIQNLVKLDLDNPLFTGAVSPSIQSLTGGYTHINTPLNYIDGGVLYTNELDTNYFVLIPHSPKLLMSQLRLTKSRKVSLPAPVYKRSKLYITPQVCFYNQSYSKFTSQDPLTRITTTLTRLSENKPLILQSISTGIQALFRGFADKLYKAFSNGDPIGNHIQDTSSFLGYISNLVKVGSTKVKIKIIDLPINSEGYRVYVSGKEIRNYTLLEDTSLSLIIPETLKTNLQGIIYIEFNLPSDLYCGVHSVELKSDLGISYAKSQIGVYNNLFTEIVFSALENWGFNFTNPISSNFLLRGKPSSYDLPAFQASDSLINPGTIPSVNLITNSLEQQFPILFDSIYQTFKLTDYQFLTSIRIKLKSIALNSDLILNLGEVDNVSLQPNRSYIASAFSSNYLPSALGNTWTEFSFSYPVLLQANKTYCLSLTSKETGYEVYSAEISAIDLLTNISVGDQLYLDGELFYSNDGKSLERVVKEDLTHEIIRAGFNNTEEVIVNLGNYGIVNNITSVTSFIVNTRDVILPDTFIQYQYKLDGSENWINFEANKLVILDNPIFNFNIRAKLNSLRFNLSPMLMLEGSSVSLYRGLDISTVISTQIIHEVPYSNVYVNLQYLIPNGTDIKVYYSPTDGLEFQGQQWFELIKDSSTEKYIDQGLQVKEATWFYNHENSSLSNGEPRVKFKYKIEFYTSNVAVQASVLNIISYVN